MLEDSLEIVASEVRTCEKCGLCRARTNGVPGEGSPNAEIMFIGEGPGFNEDQQGRPFVGAAGQLLNEMIRLIGMRREEVFITNVVRCRPPNNRDPMPDELKACDEYTQRQIAILQPRVIVTLGRYSMARFFGPGPMRELHGRSITWNGIACIAQYHPAYILRDRSPAVRKIFEDDFRKIPLLLAEQRKARKTAAEPAEAPEPAPSLDQLRLL